MDAVRGIKGAHRRQRRRWRFGSALFDEGRWALLIDGSAVPLEAKPLELLHELLLRAGETVSKDELLDAVWPNVSVVEASLATAVLKLRRALGDDERDSRIIQTVPRIGYRLAVPVECETVAAAEPGAPKHILSRLWQKVRRRPLVTAGAALLLVAGVVGALLMLLRGPPSTARVMGNPEAASAIRRLDVARIEVLLRSGWDPNAPFDAEGNGALNVAIEMCEWNPGHDRDRLLLMVRTLFEGGGRLDARNRWGDTPYSIASARRFCGPDHPVTRMIHRVCFTGGMPMGDRCRAARDVAGKG